MRDDDTHPFQAEDDAATPLTNDEKTGLIPSWVTYRHELNEVEQLNIAKGAQWGFRQKRREFLDERFVCDLHKRTLGEVWNGRADIGPQSGTSASPPGESPQTFAGCSTTPVCGWNRWYSDPMNW